MFVLNFIHFINKGFQCEMSELKMLTLQYKYLVLNEQNNSFGRNFIRSK